MIRFFREWAEVLVYAVFYVWYVVGIKTYQELRAAVIDHVRSQTNGPDLAWINSTTEVKGIRETIKLAEVVEVGIAQLRTPRQDGDLLDAIVEATGMPFRMGLINRDFVHALERAILRPDEVQKLKQIISNKETTCFNCHRTLLEGELVTFQGRESHRALSCARCTPPTLIANTCCHSHSEINPKRAFIIQKDRKCPTHTANPGAPAVENVRTEPPLPMTEAVQTIDQFVAENPQFRPDLPTTMVEATPLRPLDLNVRRPIVPGRAVAARRIIEGEGNRIEWRTADGAPTTGTIPTQPVRRPFWIDEEFLLTPLEDLPHELPDPPTTPNDPGIPF